VAVWLPGTSAMTLFPAQIRSVQTPPDGLQWGIGLLLNWILMKISRFKTVQVCYDDSTLLFPTPLFQVIAMQILYITAIVAVSVLCLALLSTARRILHATPSTGSAMALGNAPTMTVPFGTAEEDWDYAESSSDKTRGLFEDEDLLPEELEARPAAAPVIVLEEPRPAFLAHEAAAPAAAAVVPAPMETAPLQPTLEELEAPAAAEKTGATPRRFFTCALECALIGVSAWVLIRTQKELHRASAARARHIA
jgi:hypothetical protein